MAAAAPTPDARRPRPTLREAAIAVAADLRAAGHIAYFAGGCVRDKVMGHEPTDYDVATDAPPARVKSVFPRARGVGESFGVMLVRHAGWTIEVATFRTDGSYTDGRHPDAVEFSDAEGDAARRDFTINGLFEDPATGEVIDLVGGMADIAAGVIRAIGDPQRRIHEDRLRMLRAVRFAARFDFSIDAGTRRAIAAEAAGLEAVSRERIGQEVRRMLEHAGREQAVALMEEIGLDAVVLDEPHLVAGRRHLGRLRGEATVAAGLVAWMLDRAEAEAGLPADAARCHRWQAAMKLSNAESDQMLRILHARQRLAEAWPDLAVAARKRLAAGRGYGEAVRLLEDDRAEQVRADVAGLAASGLAPRPFVTGADLIALGLEPGPAFRQILDSLYDEQLEGRLSSRDEALIRAREAAGGVG